MISDYRTVIPGKLADQRSADFKINISVQRTTKINQRISDQRTQKNISDAHLCKWDGARGLIRHSVVDLLGREVGWRNTVPVRQLSSEAVINNQRVHIRVEFSINYRWACLLKQQTSITVDRFPPKENKLPFSVCNGNTYIYICILQICRWIDIYIYISKSISFFIYATVSNGKQKPRRFHESVYRLLTAQTEVCRQSVCLRRHKRTK